MRATTRTGVVLILGCGLAACGGGSSPAAPSASLSAFFTAEPVATPPSAVVTTCWAIASRPRAESDVEGAAGELPPPHAARPQPRIRTKPVPVVARMGLLRTGTGTCTRRASASEPPASRPAQ